MAPLYQARGGVIPSWARVRVVIAQFEGATTLRVPPLAAGLLAATVRRAGDLGDVDVRVLALRRDPAEAAALLAEAALAGVSLYTWNARYALEVARQAKSRRPELLVVAGGPSVPRREPARAAFLDRHPWVDALVLGEGERAFVDIVRAARAGEPLAAIPGVVARGAAAGPARPRLEGDAFAGVGSPYLEGTFDELVARAEIPPIAAAVLETNRGCPFACTFCDWGQAIHSRVHELPAARVEAELAWLARRKVPYLYLVDANFGIRQRDADLTRSIGRLAREHGAPRFVYFHLTKNATAKNLRTVEILREHGVATQVALSMQDFEPEVLLAIRRDNIRAADALALRERCHAQGLPTMNELLLGLPAQTGTSLRRSVVQAITPFPGDSFFLYLTRVLENAELAEPDYRARHGIETRELPQRPARPTEDGFVEEREEVVVATAAMPLDAWRDAFAFGYLVSALWNQRFLQTTLHLLAFALGADLTAFVDALLASERPRLRAVRAELRRFSDAIADGTGATLAVESWGATRREPTDAVCARILDDPAGFYAEAADEAAGLVGAERAGLVRDAIAWDALHVPPAPAAARFDHDWLAYSADIGARPRPAPRPIQVRTRSAPCPTDPAARLDRILALGWAKQARVLVERAPEPVPEPFAPAPWPLDPDEAARRARADGVLYLPRLLPAERLDDLRAVVDAALARRGWRVDGRSDPALRLGGWDDARWIAFLAEVAASAPYRTLAAAPEILDVMRLLVGGEPRLHVGDVCRLVSPGALDLTTPPHQDAAYLKEADGVWTAWLPVEPCPRALGPLAVLPASHHDGLRTHAPVMRGGPLVGLDVPDDAPWRASDLEVGDAIVFSSLTVHKALPNLTRDRLRVSVDYRYRRAARD
jgi:hypothetical protein